jgi:hypothetical protein
MATKFRHPNSGDLYTPVSHQLIDLFERMRQEHGSWRVVCAVSDTRLKVLRNMRRGARKSISQRSLDRLCTTTGVGSIREFEWFTADEMVRMGVWDPVLYVEGKNRIWSDDLFEDDEDDEDE